MRPLTTQAKGIQEFVVDRLDDLSDTGQPATRRLGPVKALTGLVGRSHQINLSLFSPPSPWSLESLPQTARQALLSLPGQV